MKVNNRVDSDVQKRRRFALPLLAAGYAQRYVVEEMQLSISMRQNEVARHQKTVADLQKNLLMSR
jgi:hypothetical protein